MLYLYIHPCLLLLHSFTSLPAPFSFPVFSFYPSITIFRHPASVPFQISCFVSIPHFLFLSLLSSNPSFLPFGNNPSVHTERQYSTLLGLHERPCSSSSAAAPETCWCQHLSWGMTSHCRAMHCVCLLCRLWSCTVLSVWPSTSGHGMLCTVSASGRAGGCVVTCSGCTCTFTEPVVVVVMYYWYSQTLNEIAYCINILWFAGD